MGNGWTLREMGAEEVPELQRFFAANDDYFREVNGEPPRSDEAQREIDELPPAGMAFRRNWMLWIGNVEFPMAAMADGCSDFLADGVWHIGLFMVDRALRGTGAATGIYEALESWMRSSGARWLRLGVVEGNAGAESFWQKLGYVEVRRRLGVEMGKRRNTVRVLVKPLGDEGLAKYLELVARDRPGAD